MKRTFALAAMAAVATWAQASQLTVSSYDMPNGYTGSYNYWDKYYTGSGATTTDGAPLSGGVGDLTDGFISPDNWFVAESPSSGDGPYVGWTIDPVITVHFSSTVMVDSIRLFLDDSDGAGGVSAPDSVDINATNFVVAEPAGSAPFEFDINNLGLNTDSLTITLHRKNSWVFMSEMQFYGDVVPEPASMSVLALGGLALLRKRARKA